MYGISSPLPSFYTEDLLYEANEDNYVVRDFIDIINTVTYQLFIRTLLKYNVFLQVAEEHNPNYLEYLWLLAGLEEKSASSVTQEELPLLRYGGIFNQAPRSALGLKTVLKDALGVEVRIEQCIPCVVSIPMQDRTRLGVANSMLGETTHIGSETEDATHLFRIVIGPVASQDAAGFLPGGSSYRKADFLTGRYLDRPLDYEFRILIDADKITPVRPGDPHCSMLGINTWFAPPAGTATVAACFSGNSAGGNTRGRPRRTSRCYV